MVELKKSEMDVKDEHKIAVYYDGEVVGDYEADLIVDDAVIIELKSKSSCRFMKHNW